MGVVWFVIQLIVVGLYTFYTWNKYVNWRKQHVLVSISTYIGWYFSFLIILVLPLDVAIVRKTFFISREALDFLQQMSTGREKSYQRDSRRGIYV